MLKFKAAQIEANKSLRISNSESENDGSSVRSISSLTSGSVFGDCDTDGQLIVASGGSSECVDSVTALLKKHADGERQ